MDELTKQLDDVLTKAFGPFDRQGGGQTEGTFHDWQVVSDAVAALAPRFGPVVGISGSQGSGKSTLAASLCARLQAASGAPTAAVSLDDFYLTRASREALSTAVHPLLRTRGVPGTHEHERLADVLDRVQAGAAELALPVFDKGADDRASERSVTARRLVLEGWCLGLEPVPAETLEPPINDLERNEDPHGIWRRWVNDALAQHYAPLWRRVDFWIHLRVPGFDQVYAWRRQQEDALPVAQRMRDAELVRFIAHYERWTRMLWAQPPKGPGLVLEIDAAHRVDAFRCRSVASP